MEVTTKGTKKYWQLPAKVCHHNFYLLGFFYSWLLPLLHLSLEWHWEIYKLHISISVKRWTESYKYQIENVFFVEKVRFVLEINLILILWRLILHKLNINKSVPKKYGSIYELLNEFMSVFLTIQWIFLIIFK